MITYVESNERIDALTKRTAVERVAFERAAGHFLACPVVAKLDSPRRNVSAMDGYAIRDSDIENLPARLTVSGVSYPGEAARQNLAPGECHRVFPTRCFGFPGRGLELNLPGLGTQSHFHTTETNSILPFYAPS